MQSSPNSSWLTTASGGFRFTDMDLLAPYQKGYTVFMIYENAIEDPSPIDRIRFIFQGNNLVAIIHSRDPAWIFYPL